MSELSNSDEHIRQSSEKRGVSMNLELPLKRLTGNYGNKCQTIVFVVDVLPLPSTRQDKFHTFPDLDCACPVFCTHTPSQQQLLLLESTKAASKLVILGGGCFQKPHKSMIECLTLLVQQSQRLLLLQLQAAVTGVTEIAAEVATDLKSAACRFHAVLASPNAEMYALHSSQMLVHDNLLCSGPTATCAYRPNECCNYISCVWSDIPAFAFALP